ncbi:uncharacterized protein PV09_07532 [Verruconis gallopava]|uniref:Uncharacterized protein n=1 Tax=Verruconis gallopava TaxID=253628 RepID=A0A0D2A3N8_9PEZI|nr:uncharacterized protein PV09_07532 [Verruconis gallopava]KIW01015.1 hypothetical protein PV09_07532 [Verruconis gallopava]
MAAFTVPFPVRKATKKVENEWKTWRLSRWYTVGLLLVEASMIVVILVLERYSATHQGIATVPHVETDQDFRLSIISMFWTYGLLWTALPSFLMGLYRIGWDAIVMATAERQPYVEINRDEQDASTARETIMLDYRTYPLLYNWLVAFRLKHVLIGCAMMLSSVLSIALVPLASHILASAPAIITSEYQVTIPYTFDSAPLASLDLETFISMAKSTQAYGAEPPPWSMSKYAFEAINLTDIDTRQNYTIPVNAYYGQVDCKLLNVPPPSISSNSLNQTVLSFNITDRGCVIMPVQVYISENSPSIVARTWESISCGEAAHTSRVMILTGKPTSLSEMSNLTVVSCIPSYWKTSGLLSIRVEKRSSPTVDKFDEDTANKTEFRPFGANIFEPDLTSYTQLDPKGTFQTDLFAATVYEVAKKSNPADPLDSNTLKTAMESVWPSIFAYVTAISLIQSPMERTVEAQARRFETRLFVVPPVAWTIVIVMILVLICNALLILHAELNHSILLEEPIGLLGAAVLLQNSDVAGLVAQVRGEPPDDIKVREEIKKKDLAGSRCWFDSTTKTIRLSGLGWNPSPNPTSSSGSGSALSAVITTNSPPATPAPDPHVSPVTVVDQGTESSGLPDTEVTTQHGDGTLEDDAESPPVPETQSSL